MKDGAVLSAALIILSLGFNFYLRYQKDFFRPVFGFERRADVLSVNSFSNSNGAFLSSQAFPEDFLGFAVVESSFVLNPAGPLRGSTVDRSGLLLYKIQRGDTIAKIAANFGISMETVLAANPSIIPFLLKPGEEIILLPVSGVAHRVREGDNLDVLAAFYDVDPRQIAAFNRDLTKILQTPGATIIIPGAKSSKIHSAFVFKDNPLPDLKNYFSIPTTGWNWGQLHYNNAVDIANSCGVPIFAAAEGLVIDERSDGWNNGYGRYVRIEHPNKVETLYAHTQSNKVKVGDYAQKGDLIAYIGNSGNTHGPTGCHLHFEIHGAKNPFAKY